MSGVGRPEAWPPVDDDPKHVAIIEKVTRDIVRLVADELAERIVAEVARGFLGQKTVNLDLAQRLSVLEDVVKRMRLKK